MIFSPLRCWRLSATKRARIAKRRMLTAEPK